MRILAFLQIKKLKNQLKCFFKSPQRVIAFVIIAAMVLVSLITAMTAGQKPVEDRKDINELYAILTLLYASVFFLLLNNGFSNGASMFSMADVNMVFMSPVSPNKILLYGMLQQMGRSLLLGIFILFQYGWIYGRYGVRYMFIVAAVIGYAIVLFISQLISMLIYVVVSTSGKEKIIKGIYYVFILLIPAYIAIRSLQAGEFSIKLVTVFINGSFVRFFPVIGWCRMFSQGLYDADAICILLSLAAIAVTVAAVIFTVLKITPNYYEDVLQSAEVSYSAITASKEGKVNEAAPKVVKLGKTGLGAGFGASAIYYKHKIENRRSKIFVVGIASLVSVITAIIAAFLTHDVVYVFLFTTYMQIMLSATGRMPRELTLPYIYMIPEDSFIKLIQSLREAFPRACIDAVLMYIPMIPILGVSPLSAVCCVLARVSFEILFLSCNVAIERLFGTVQKKAVITIVYMIGAALSTIPAIVCSSILGNIVSSKLSIIAGMSGAFIANIPVILLLLFISRDIFMCSEFNNK